jgi:hypothetical protein
MLKHIREGGRALVPYGTYEDSDGQHEGRKRYIRISMLQGLAVSLVPLIL